MSDSIHTTETFNEEKPKNTKKWWLIGCGGCLVLLLLVGGLLALALTLGFNNLKGASDKAMSNILGPSYHAPEGYLAFALPLGNSKTPWGKLENVGMMVPTDHDKPLIMLMDTTLLPEMAATAQSHDPKVVAKYLQSTSALFVAYAQKSERSDKRFRDLAVDTPAPVKLHNGRTVLMAPALAEVEKNGVISYDPAIIALIPEANHRLVTLFAMAIKNSEVFVNQKPEAASLKTIDQSLTQQLKALIEQSELDDRLLK